MKKILITAGVALVCVVTVVAVWMPTGRKMTLTDNTTTAASETVSAAQTQSNIAPTQPQGTSSAVTTVGGTTVASATTAATTNAETTAGVSETLPAAGGQETVPPTTERFDKIPAPIVKPQVQSKANLSAISPLERIILLFGFEYDADQDIFYSSIEPWQKDFGFNSIYDFFSTFGAMIYDTERFKFSYGGYDWLFQVWKGRYGITTGGEMGIYTKFPSQDSGHFEAVFENQYVTMDFKLYKMGEPYMFREPVKHWWLTGFKLGEIYYSKDLYMEMTYYLEIDEMADALEDAVKAEGFTYGKSDRGYIRDGNYIRIYWQ